MKKIFCILFSLFLVAFSSSVFAITKKDAQTLVEQRKYDAAITALNTLMKQSAYAKDGDCNKLLGQSLCMTGRYKEAVRPLETAIRMNKRSGAQWYLAITRQHLYDFEGALEAIKAYRPVLKSDFWIARADSLEAECQQGLRAINHIEDVEIIDSLLVHKSSFFKYYKLGSESGKITQGGAKHLEFENQAADYRLYAIDGSLYERYKIQNTWEEPHLVKGVGSEEFKIITPFLRADGETLYFACDSTPGMGGFDIYKTRFNAEEKSYYQPQRLGMPFNSPFNDYMMAIDETHQVGWWATERDDRQDSLLIFIFKIRDDPEYLNGANVSRARIDRIADTWRQAGGYKELMAEIKSDASARKAEETVNILIHDGLIYHSAGDFKSQKARMMYEQSLQVQKMIAEKESLLADLRMQYSKASTSEKQKVESRIQKEETELLHLYDMKIKEEKQYRSLEQTDK